MSAESINDNVKDLIIPCWPTPPIIGSAVTTRFGGVSLPPYDSFNLATHVGDDPASVRLNRLSLVEQLGLPAEPAWLEQTHSVNVVHTDQTFESAAPLNADASIGTRRGDCGSHRNDNSICVVLTADCLPILLCDKAGEQIAAVHAGWRGLVNGIVDATISSFQASPQQIMAWLGPAISQPYFEVGAEVKAQFENKNLHYQAAFKPAARAEHWYADLYVLAKIQLQALGVTEIYGGGYCTYSDSTTQNEEQANRFYSYRRDRETGRIASLIWFKN